MTSAGQVTRGQGTGDPEDRRSGGKEIRGQEIMTSSGQEVRG
jgi:hypothetical protein